MPASAFQGAAAEHSGYLWKQGKGFWKRFDKRWFVLIPGEVPGTKMLLCELPQTHLLYYLSLAHRSDTGLVGA